MALRLATRGSKLALAQAGAVAEMLGRNGKTQAASVQRAFSIRPGDLRSLECLTHRIAVQDVQQSRSFGDAVVQNVGSVAQARQLVGHVLHLGESSKNSGEPTSRTRYE